MDFKLIPYGDDTYILYLSHSIKYYLISSRNARLLQNAQPLPHGLAELITENSVQRTIVPEAKLGAVGLTLNISNKCNMRCVYCYASKGVYHSKESMMSPETAKKAAELFLEHFGALGRIKFFGGEPLLNYKVISEVCELCSDLYRQGRIARMPEFNMVTNGTILNDAIFALINKFDIGVTFSYDGTPQLQNFLRPLADGGSSAQIVERNIRRLQRMTDGKKPSNAEITYTKLHEQAGISVRDAVLYVRQQLGIQRVSITPVSADCHDPWALTSCDSFVQAVTDSFDVHQPDLVPKIYGIYRQLKNGRAASPLFCGAGINRFSVSAAGDVYPCYLFTDDTEFRIGNIHQFDLCTYEEKRKSLLRFNRYDTSNCRNCFAARLCNGCSGNNRYLTGKADIPAESVCNMLRSVVERILLEMADRGEIPLLREEHEQ